MTVGDAVRGNLVAGGVEVVHLAVVGPLVGHEEGGSDGAAVGVQSILKESLVEISVEIVDGIVKGQNYKLGCLVLAETSRDTAPTETGRERTVPFTGIRFGSSRIPLRLLSWI